VKNNMVGAAIQMVAFLAHYLPFVAVAAQKTCLVGREALQEHTRGQSTSKHRKSLYDGWGDEREWGEGVEGSMAAPRERTLKHIFPNVSQSFCENSLLQLLHATLFWSFALEPYELGINPSLYNANLNIS
jgi:hypothetical protein